MQAPNLDQILRKAGPFDPNAMPLAEAKRTIRDAYCLGHGYASRPDLLTKPESQTKLGKSLRPAYGLTLAPSTASGFNVCTWSTPDCVLACVMSTGGRNRFANVKNAHNVKTQVLAAHPQAFVTVLAWELSRAVAKHGAIDFRPNVASDLRWEHIAPALLEIPGVRVYDYTKAPAQHREPSDNYRLTFSVSERDASTREALDYLANGNNAAVVFATLKGHPLPATWNGFDVIDGDKSDSRADDAPGVVVGLRAKGDARGGFSAGGFVKANVAS